ncbi:MAG: YabP/YqfC family sporulation protein, partial [Clostridiales bacterium]|nr:YabP/YqfC family sporulation protein [Clostridiales bacterium]
LKNLSSPSSVVTVLLGFLYSYIYSMRKQSGKKSSERKTSVSAASGLNLPGDLVFGDAIVTITGRREMTVENYRGILVYEETVVRLSLKKGQILISGNALHIDYYTNDDMKISGRIDRLEYMI